MTFACAECGQDSGCSLVCKTCIPELSEYKRQKYLRAWHRIIVQAAGNACQDCGHSAEFDSGELTGDHIETRGARPDLVLDVTNGVCRCLGCHNKRHTGEHAILPAMKNPKRPEPKRKVEKAPLCKRCHRLLALPSKKGSCVQCPA